METELARLPLTLFAGVAMLTLHSMVSVAQTNQLTVSPGNIYRFGDTRDMDCTVQMEITGSLASNASAITDVRIHRATDDTGKDLTHRVVHFPRFGVYPFAAPAAATGKTTGWLAVLHLKSPGESAKTIQQIQGEIDLAFPTAENGGLLKVTNLMANPGQEINAASLAKHGIKLTFHTFESYADFHRANPKKYVDDRELVVERNCFSGIYGSPTNPPRSSIAIQVEDPRKMLIGLGFETQDGQRFRATSSCALPTFRCYRFEKPPPPDLNLVVTVAAPGVIRTELFSMVDTELPWNRAPKLPAEPPDPIR
jgi:hypothetical protein